MAGVRIDYEISPSGEPKVRSLADAVEQLRQREAALAAQLSLSDEAARKSGAAIDALQAKIKGLGGSQSVDLDVTKALSDAKANLADILSINQKLASERISLNIDDAGIRRASDETKSYLALLQAIQKEQAKALLTDPERINTARTVQLEALNQFRGTRPESELVGGLENRINQGADTQLLASRRAPISAGASSLEDNAALREQIRLRREILASEEAVNRLIEKNNLAELTGVQRIRAEQERVLGLYGKTPELREKITRTFDRQVARQEEEDKARAHGNPRRLILGAKDLAEGYSRGAVIEGVDYLMSLRGGGAAAGGSGGAGGGGILSGIGSGAIAGIALAGTTAGVALLSKHLTELVEHEGLAARELENFASRLGLTVNQASALSAEAKIAGVDVETLAGAARYLSQALEDPAGSGRKVATALRDMGIASYDASGKERELGQVTLDVIEKLSQYPTAAERAFRATQLLGRGGAKELLPLIERHQQLKAVAADLGFGNVEELTKKLGDADDEFQKLHLSVQLLKKELAGLAVPIIVPIIRQITNFTKPDPAENPEARYPGVQFSHDYKERQAQVALLDAQTGLSARTRASTEAGATAEQNRISRAVADAYLSKHANERDELQLQLTEAKKHQQEQEAILRNPTDVTPSSIQRAATQADTYRSQVKSLETQIKAIEAGPHTENQFAAELDRIAAEDYKAQHPASEFGRIPELQTQLQDTIAGYRRDEQFQAHPRELQALIAARQQQENRDVILEARRVGGNQEFQRFGEQRIDTEAGIAGLQSQFALAQRLAALRTEGKSETEEDVEAAYQKQLELARQIRDIHLNDLQIEKEKLAATGDHSHDRDLAKDEAEAHKQFVAEQIRAEAERAERTAAIHKQEQDAALHAQQELGRLQTETEVRGYADRIEHAQRLADINRQPNEAPTASVESAYQTRLQLAQLEHDTVIRENAITYSGSDPDTVAKRNIANREAYNRLVEDGQKAEYEREERLAELRKQERDQAKQQAASLYDALRGGSKSTREFFRAQLNDIGRNVFSAGLAPFLQSASNIINPSGGGLLGTALQGTLLGSSTGASQALANPNAQSTGFFGRIEHALGLGAPHSQPQPVVNTPVLASHTEPLITSLDSTRDAIRDLTAAILGTNGTVSTAPVPHVSLTPPQGPLPGITELGAHSLVTSSQNAVAAVQTLTDNAPARGPIQTPRFSPTIHVQPTAVSVVAPATGPSYNSTVSNAYHQAAPTPISVPQKEQVTSTINYGPPGETGQDTSASENISPHGFSILGGKELAATSLTPGILSKPSAAKPEAEPAAESDRDTGILNFLKNTFNKTTDVFNVENLLHGIDAAAESLQAGDVKGAIQALDPGLGDIEKDTTERVQKGDYSGALANVIALAAPLGVSVPNPIDAAIGRLRIPAGEHPPAALPSSSRLLTSLLDERGSVGLQIKAAREQLAAAEPTARINTPERAQLRQSIVDDLYKPEGVTKGKQAYLIIGPPASGKSTIATPLVKETGSLLIDADEAKEKLPEFQGGTGAAVVHDEESSDIANRVFEKAADAGLNIVQPVIGKTIEGLRARTQALEKRGYDVHLILSDLPADKAAVRAVERFQKTGRFLDPSYVQSVADAPAINFGILKKEGGLASYANLSQDVPLGQSPRVVERSGNTPRLLDSFGRSRPQVLPGDGRTTIATPPRAPATSPDSFGLQGLIPPPELSATRRFINALLDETGSFGPEAAPEAPRTAPSINSLPEIAPEPQLLAPVIDASATVAPTLSANRLSVPPPIVARPHVVARPHTAPHIKPSDLEAEVAPPVESGTLPALPEHLRSLVEKTPFGEKEFYKRLSDTLAPPLPGPPLPTDLDVEGLNPDLGQYSATERFINQPIPAPEVGSISSLSTSPSGFPILANKDLASIALSPGILADSSTPVSAPVSTASATPVGSLPASSPALSSAFENYAASQFPHTPTVPSLLASLPAQFQAPSFATQHPTIVHTGGTIEQLAALSAPAAIRTRDELGDLQYNKYAIGTAAYGDVGVLLKAFDKRSPDTAASGGLGNDILNTVESLFGVQRPTAPPSQSGQTSGSNQSPLGGSGTYAGVPVIYNQPAQSSGPFNSAGAQILSQAQRTAANPFSGGPAILHTGQSVLSGLGNIYSDYKAIQNALHPPKTAPGQPTTTGSSGGSASSGSPSVGPYDPLDLNIATPGTFPQNVQSLGLAGVLPTEPGQTLPGQFENAGTSLTRLESGLILRQTPGQLADTAPAVSSSISYGQPGNIGPDVTSIGNIPNYTSLPGAPAFAEAGPTSAFNPTESQLFGIPSPPAFAGPSFDVINPSADDAAIHAGVINNGLSARQFGFNTDGGTILPKSVLDAANPFNSVGSTFNTIMSIGQSLAGGIGSLGGLGGGSGDAGDDSSSPSGYATSESINFGDGSIDLGGSTGLFGGGGDSSPPGSNYDANGNFLFNSPGAGGIVGFGGGDDGSSGSSNTLSSLLGSLGSQGSGLAKAVGGFARGGAKGTSSGIANTLGVAAAVDPEPISKAILGMSAAVAGIVSALLGDPRARRQKHLTSEIETDKLAAFPYTQPGINVTESAAGGKSVDTDFLGDTRVLNSKPYVYDINEAVGFDPIHPNRVVTQAVRQVGYTPLPGIPSTPVSPLASTDLTAPVRLDNSPISYPGTTGSAAQIATQQQQQSPISIQYTNNNTFNNHSLDGADLMRRAPDLATAIQSQIIDGNHRLRSDLINLVNVT